MSKSKYQIIAEEIKTKIETNEYVFNQTIPPEMQLQKDYAVSRHTVRQAIAVLVNEGYLRKAKGSGTYIDNRFKNDPKATATPKTIGVITTYLSDYIFPSIIRGIEGTLRSQGYSLLLASTNNDYQQEKECLEKMINYGVQGLIVEPTKSNQYNPNLALYLSLKEQGIPMVMINAVYEELEAAYICVDDVCSGFLATELMIKKGNRNLLLVSKIDNLQGKYRMKGFIQACEKHGVKIQSQDIITYTTDTRKQVASMVLKRLKNEKEINGIVCYNDQIASIIVDNLYSQGLRIPDDISIIGNDDSSLSKIGSIKMTTLKHPKEEMGKDAAEWIIKTIEKNSEQKSILYEPILIERDSVSDR